MLVPFCAWLLLGYFGLFDLGLGRAPGTDRNTMRALRRDALSADTFPQDVVELRAYLAGQTRVPGVDAIPGKGTRVVARLPAGPSTGFPEFAGAGVSE